MTAVLELAGVSRIYGEGVAEVQALVDIDLTVVEGELVAVMGPSGSGKSTLLTIAGTLDEASEGTVTIDGIDVAGLSRNARAQLRRRSIGYVFQDFNLLAGLTAAENVALPLELDGVGLRAARAAARDALEPLGVADRSGRYPDELSGGERQRVAIARAVVGDRRLLLADEPTGALDSVNGEDVMRLLRRACARGVAGVIVTHDAQLAAWADRWSSCGTGAWSIRRPDRPDPSRCSHPEPGRDLRPAARSAPRAPHPHPPQAENRRRAPGATSRAPLGLPAVPARVASAGARGGAAHAGGHRRGGRVGGGPRHGPDRGRRSRLRRPPHRPDRRRGAGPGGCDRCGRRHG